MKAFSVLTRRGQVRRLRRLAQSVLPEYPLAHCRLTTIGRGFNTTFCVHTRQEVSTATGQEVAGQDYAPNRYLLRVHRAGWYSRAGDTRLAVGSELTWLASLRQDTGLIVPEPVKTRSGDWTAVGRDDGVPDPRVCSLLRWIRGRCHTGSPHPVHLYRVGALTAQLHTHAAHWTIPADFVRPRWNWDALFGDDITYTDLTASEVWSLVPIPYRSVLEAAAMALQQAMGELGQSPEVWGLIHADLHLDNVLLANGEARAIDFDDCGFGYWIYDIAVALWELRLHKNWAAFRQAFLDGYAQVRPLPQDQLPYLDTFMAAREAMIGLGLTAMTQEIPAYLAYLEEDMRNAAAIVQAILPGS